MYANMLEKVLFKYFWSNQNNKSPIYLPDIYCKPIYEIKKEITALLMVISGHLFTFEWGIVKICHLYFYGYVTQSQPSHHQQDNI